MNDVIRLFTDLLFIALIHFLLTWKDDKKESTKKTIAHIVCAAASLVILFRFITDHLLPEIVVFMFW